MSQQSQRKFPRFLLASLALTGTLLLSACSVSNLFANKDSTPEAKSVNAGVTQSVEQEKLLGIIPIYRPDVQQGNFISKEMVAQLKVGMTPDQVRFVLGTPLLTDVFHEQRWDYPFRIKRGGRQVTSSLVSVYFKDGRMTHFEGGELPDEKDYLQRIATPKKQ